MLMDDSCCTNILRSIMLDQEEKDNYLNLQL